MLQVLVQLSHLYNFFTFSNNRFVFLLLCISMSSLVKACRLLSRSVDWWLMANRGKEKSRRSLSRLMRQVINICDSIMIQSSTFLNVAVMNLNQTVMFTIFGFLLIMGRIMCRACNCVIYCRLSAVTTAVHRRSREDVHVDVGGGYRLQVG